MTYSELGVIDPERSPLPHEVTEQVEILIKYEGYIKKQEAQVAKFRRQEGRRIPKDLDFDQVQGLSFEGKERLTRLKPRSLGEALNCGVTPADLAVLGIYLERGGSKNV